MATKLELQMKAVIKGFVESNEAVTAIDEVDSLFHMAVTTAEFADMETNQRRNYVDTYKTVRSLLQGIATIEQEVRDGH